MSDNEETYNITLNEEDTKMFNLLTEQITKLTFLIDHHLTLATQYQNSNATFLNQRQEIINRYLPKKPALQVIKGGKS